MKDSFYKRVARVEAFTNAQKEKTEEVLREAYLRACEAGDAEGAAALARRLRNALLDATDKEMSLDRLGLDASSAARFISSLAAVFTGEWARYRQALRDLPGQKGFPFDIEFPVPPGSEGMEDD